MLFAPTLWVGSTSRYIYPGKHCFSKLFGEMSSLFILTVRPIWPVKNSGPRLLHVLVVYGKFHRLNERIWSRRNEIILIATRSLDAVRDGLLATQLGFVGIRVTDSNCLITCSCASVILQGIPPSVKPLILYHAVLLTVAEACHTVSALILMIIVLLTVVVSKSKCSNITQRIEVPHPFPRYIIR